MSQVFDSTKPTSGITTFGELYQVIIDHNNALRSAFSGVSFPTNAVNGQPCWRTDRGDDGLLYVYTGNSSRGESGWISVVEASVIGQELINARGTKSSLDQRLDVALNEDGTLKSTVEAYQSEWVKPSLTFTYVNTTSFEVEGDQTDIYTSTRRLKINLFDSVSYSEVVSSVFGTVTTITILDAVLNDTLVSVEHSIIKPNSSLTPSMIGAYSQQEVDDAVSTLSNKISIPASTMVAGDISIVGTDLTITNRNMLFSQGVSSNGGYKNTSEVVEGSEIVPTSIFTEDGMNYVKKIEGGDFVATLNEPSYGEVSTTGDYFLPITGKWYDLLGVEYTTAITYLNKIVEVASNEPVDLHEYNPPTFVAESIKAENVEVSGEFVGKNACTAWVNFDGTTTPPTINDSSNVSDVVRTGDGIYEVYFEEDMSSLSYGILVCFDDNGSRVTASEYANKTVGKVTVRIGNAVSTTNTTKNYINRYDITLNIFGGR